MQLCIKYYGPMVAVGNAVKYILAPWNIFACNKNVGEKFNFGCFICAKPPGLAIRAEAFRVVAKISLPFLCGRL